MRGIRFIHTADLHLGSSLKSVGRVSGHLQERLHNATFGALERIVNHAIEGSVDFMVISGDIYDLESRSIRANRILSEQLDRLKRAGIPVFAIAGNHDPVPEEPEPIALPENVHVFGSAEPEERPVEKRGQMIARVIGQSYRGVSDSRKMCRHYIPTDSRVWNIGLLHSGLDPNNPRYVPCSLSDLTLNRGIHYWALGHIHRQAMIRDRDPVVVYPGIPQGRDVGECGLQGCAMVELHPARPPKVYGIPTGSIVWLKQEIPIGGGCHGKPRTIDELVGTALAYCKSIQQCQLQSPIPMARTQDTEGLIEGYIVRWVLTGRGELHQHLAEPGGEAIEELEESLQERLPDADPFFRTDSVEVETGYPIPPIEVLAGQREVYREIREISDQMFPEGDLAREVHHALGQVWERDFDPEQPKPEKFSATEEAVRSMTIAARQRLVEAVFRLRESE